MERRINIISPVFVLILLVSISIADAVTLDFDGYSNSDGRKFFYHPDTLGSTELVTNESGGTVEETTYEPFGEVIEGGQASEFLYTSKELDDQTGLYYFGARYYNTSIPLFTQPDSTITDANMRGETR